MLLYIVGVPCTGAFFLPILGQISARLRNYAALALALFPLIGTISIASGVFAGRNFDSCIYFNNSFDFILYADGLAVFMGIVSALISSIIIFYSFGYISHYENQNEYYLMVLLFLGGMLGLIFSQNLIFLYLFWEITAITSWRLIGFFREKQHVIRVGGGAEHLVGDGEQQVAVREERLGGGVRVGHGRLLFAVCLFAFCLLAFCGHIHQMPGAAGL
jgi:NADH:ubiquinone oxidoreductase subunit 5 (subunit L)/multisubunit Na+/H+ antiporter MnhA subunit